jgi:hypothetical protein
VVVFGGAGAIAAALFVLWAFQRWGEDTFTRSARTVEARGRAYELAAGIARCMNRTERAELPPSAGPIPPVVQRTFHVAHGDRTKVFSADAFVCAGFHPAGELHMQIEWKRDDATHATAIARVDEHGDPRADVEARSRVRCEGAPPERCHADNVEERPLD